MLNTNLNINLFGKQITRFSDNRNNWYWNFDNDEVVFATTELPTQSFATFSLNTSGSNAYNISSDNGDYFLAPSFQPVTASITGSGVWPTTGSFTMSLFVYGQQPSPLPPLTYYAERTASAAEGNIASVSGSIVELKFLSNQKVIYQVSASLIHRKGNLFNPPINWKNVWINKKPSGSGQFTFNAVKNANVFEVSGSNTSLNQSGSFNNEYSFSVTSSLTGSVVYDDWYYAQTTMSLSIPEVGISRQLFFTGSVSGILTASFTASTDTPYTITSSVESKYIDPIYIESYIIGGGGGGAAGGTTGGDRPVVVSLGAGGGAGSWKKVQFYVRPNQYYTASAGTGGAAGIALTGSINGSNGTTSSLSYFTSISSSATINAPGGFGGNGITGKGGQSGDGFAGGDGLVDNRTPNRPIPFGGGGGGTIGTGTNADLSYGGNGGAYLGGGGGDWNQVQNWSNSNAFGNGAPSPSGSVVSGDGGNGGYTYDDGRNPPTNFAGSDATAYGGGGGGGWGAGYGATAGGKGGNGVIVLRYQATSSLITFSPQIPSNATEIREGYVYHYITGSNVNFAYIGVPN
jgi:hypothetical protein